MDQKSSKREEQTPDPENSRRLPLSHGPTMLLQLFLCLTIVLSLNYFAANHQSVWDLSQDKGFSLSNQTRKLLQSELLGDREKPVEIIAAVRRNSAHYQRISSIVRAYERLSEGKIRVQLIDYVRDSDAALVVADEYETAFIEDTIIINAVPSTTPDSESEPPPDRSAKMRRAHIRFIAVQDMRVFSSDSQRGQRLIGYQDEDQITAALRRALEGSPRRLYFLADKSQITGSEDDSPWNFLSRTFASLNVELTPIRISGIERIPKDAAGVALIAPRFDLNTQEMSVLRDYWERPKGA
ncbi:MAG: GldG family protein, partial [Roseibacillus sp.]|nr:GldG family protein [Roseibacillus sp.]